MVPDISVTVLAFSACLVAAEPNWKMALRLSLTLAGSYSVSSARAAKPQASIMATSASLSRFLMLSPLGISFALLVLKLGEATLRVGRAELGGALIPGARLRRIGRDVTDILRSQHIGIIGLRQQQRRTGLLRIRGPFEQQPRGWNVA